MFCPNCGNKLSDEVLFCENCGTRVSDSVPAPAANSKSKSGVPTALKIGLPVGLGVVAIALVVVLIFVINGNSDGDGSTVPMAEQTSAPVNAEPTQEPASGDGASTEQPTPTADTGSDEESEPTPEPEPTEPPVLSKSECRELCDELYNEGTISNAHKQTLLNMSNRVLSCTYDKKDVVFSDMDDELRRRIEVATLCGFWNGDEGPIVDAIDRSGDMTYTYDKEEALDYWQHFWGRDPEIPVTIYDYSTEDVYEEDGDTLTYEWEDGDSGPGFYGYPKHKVQVYENDSFYLVAGQEDYHPFAEVLIRKDEWELPGTIVYARNGNPDEIPIKKITATSHLSNYKNKTYVASNMIDGNRKTVWATDGSAIGESIDISLYDEQRIHGIAIMNGYQESTYLYKINGKVKRISVSADYGDESEYRVDYTINSDMYSENLGKYEYIFFKKPMDASSLSIGIWNTASGKKYSDTCVSEVYLF